MLNFPQRTAIRAAHIMIQISSSRAPPLLMAATRRMNDAVIYKCAGGERPAHWRRNNTPLKPSFNPVHFSTHAVAVLNRKSIFFQPVNRRSTCSRNYCRIYGAAITSTPVLSDARAQPPSCYLCIGCVVSINRQVADVIRSVTRL